MAFPWYRPEVPAEYLSAPEKIRVMYETELRERALLLLRLGYTADDTKLRLHGNVCWDFELHTPPAHLKRIDAIVDEVFASRRSGVGGPPSVEG